MNIIKDILNDSNISKSFKNILKKEHCSDDEKYKCSECSESFIKDGRESYDVFENCICYDCVIKTHCFCEDCGELAPTSHCSVEDSELDVDGYKIEVTKVICVICDSVGYELKNRNND